VQVFELNMWKAWGAVATAVASFAASLYLISICPAPLLPFAWALSGTAFTGVSGPHLWSVWPSERVGRHGSKLAKFPLLS
jgi:hypothetical protein